LVKFSANIKVIYQFPVAGCIAQNNKTIYELLIVILIFVSQYIILVDCALRLENHVHAHEKIFRFSAFNVYAHNRIHFLLTHSENLPEQIYSFSFMHRRSVKQSPLPVTVKYPAIYASFILVQNKYLPPARNGGVVVFASQRNVI
jgi:hypothetical protein